MTWEENIFWKWPRRQGTRGGADGGGRLPGRFNCLSRLERRPGNLHFGGFHDLDDLLTCTCPAGQRGVGFLQWRPRLFRQEADVGLVLQQTGLDSTDAVVQRLFGAWGVLQVGIVRIDHAGSVVRGPHFVKFVQLHPVEIILSFRVVFLHAFGWTFAPFLLQLFPLKRLVLCNIFSWLTWQKSANNDFYKHAKTYLDNVMNIRKIYVFFNLFLFCLGCLTLGVQLSNSWMHLFTSFHTVQIISF